MPVAPRVSIQFHMVSYCSAIKAIVFKLQVNIIDVFDFSEHNFDSWAENSYYSRLSFIPVLLF